jgi:hypothetical protein
MCETSPHRRLCLLHPHAASLNCWLEESDAKTSLPARGRTSSVRVNFFSQTLAEASRRANGCSASSTLSHTHSTNLKRGADVDLARFLWHCFVINTMSEECFRCGLSLMNHKPNFPGDCEIRLLVGPEHCLGFTATPGAMIASNCHAHDDDSHPAMWRLHLPRDRSSASSAFLPPQTPFSDCGFWNRASRLQQMDVWIRTPLVLPERAVAMAVWFDQTM